MAIDKYFLGFIIPTNVSKYYDDYEPFFYAHGLEMVCKAYLLGKEYRAYRAKPFAAAKKEIDRIARRFGHELRRHIKELISLGVLPAGFLSEIHHRDSINNVVFTNLDMLMTLEAIYLEARYPVIKMDHERHYEEKIRGNRKARNKRTVTIPKMSHAVEEFSRNLFKLILAKIEKDFRLKISRSKFREDINDSDWEGFSNLFFR